MLSPLISETPEFGYVSRLLHQNSLAPVYHYGVLPKRLVMEPPLKQRDKIRLEEKVKNRLRHCSRYELLAHLLDSDHPQRS